MDSETLNGISLSGIINQFGLLPQVIIGDHVVLIIFNNILKEQEQSDNNIVYHLNPVNDLMQPQQFQNNTYTIMQVSDSNKQQYWS